METITIEIIIIIADNKIASVVIPIKPILLTMSAKNATESKVITIKLRKIMVMISILNYDSY